MVAIPPNTVDQLASMDQLDGKHVVMLFGKTKAGKSTFINDAFYPEKPPMDATGGLESVTSRICYAKEPLRIRDCDIYLVDNIGLSGSLKHQDRTHLLGLYAKTFASNRPAHPTIRSFLYFIDIGESSGNTPDNEANLRFFKDVVGTDLMKSVVFVTTKWEPVLDPSLGMYNQREAQDVRYDEWEKKINKDFKGASIIRLHPEGRCPESVMERNPQLAASKRPTYRDNVRKVLHDSIPNSAQTATLLEREINVPGGGEKTLTQTTAGQGVRKELTQQMNELANAGLLEEDDPSLKGLDALDNVKIKDLVEGARKAGSKLMGGSAIGETAGEIYEGLGGIAVGLFSMFMPKDKAARLRKRYKEVMAPRTMKAAEAGGVKGVVGVAGRTLQNWADGTAIFWGADKED